jgi:hypothetical protein
MESPRDHAQLGKAIEALFSDEPVAVGTAVSMAVTGTFSYLSFFGFIDDQTIGALSGLLTLWLPVVGLLVRSQYTPFARRNLPHSPSARSGQE